MGDEEELITVKQAAADYRVSEETIRRWMKAGHIQFTPVGPFRMKRIKRGDMLGKPMVRDNNV